MENENECDCEIVGIAHLTMMLMLASPRRRFSFDSSQSSDDEMFFFQCNEQLIRWDRCWMQQTRVKITKKIRSKLQINYPEYPQKSEINQISTDQNSIPVDHIFMTHMCLHQHHTTCTQHVQLLQQNSIAIFFFFYALHFGGAALTHSQCGFTTLFSVNHIKKLFTSLTSSYSSLFFYCTHKSARGKTRKTLYVRRAQFWNWSWKCWTVRGSAQLKRSRARWKC